MKLLKSISWAVAGFLGLLLVISGVFSLIYSPEYVYRCLAWGVLGVGEEKAETHTINAGLTPFRFSTGSTEDELSVKQKFEAIFQTQDLESYLSETKTYAFIVIQNDKLLYEHYFNSFERDSLLESHSVTKSFISALVGIAVSEGKITSIDDPITNYIPELASRDERFSKVTVRHLLRMVSGIRYEDYFFFTADSTITGTFPDLPYAITHFAKMADEPGETFVYNDFNPNILGLVLERATGVSVSNYLEEHIWQPVGMEFDAEWIMDSSKSGFEKMQGGLRARAIDFAKFGQLYLHNGDWAGQTIIPEAWVTESTQNNSQDITSPFEGFNYQYLWWGLQGEQGNSDYYAMGNYGQMIYVSPSNNLVIVRLGGKVFDSDNMMKWVKAAGAYMP